MIDEIPERDNLPSKTPESALSLTRLAILLTLVFAVLLAMLLGSRALDMVAAKLWPDPTTSQPKLISAYSGTTSSTPTPVANVNPAIGTSVQSAAETQQHNQSNLAVQSKKINQLPPLNFKKSAETPSQSTEIKEQAVASGTGTLANPLNASNSAGELGTANSVKMASSANMNPVGADKIEQEKTREALNKSNENVSETLALEQVGLAQPATDAKKMPLETSLKNAAEATQKENEQKLQQGLKSSKPHAKAKDAKQYSTSEKEILKSDPRHYTVQILGMHNKNKLKTFVNDAKLQGRVRYCRGEHQGKAWYILVYGDYATREEAQKVIAGLPEEVKKQKPWVRSVASLQGTLHARE